MTRSPTASCGIAESGRGVADPKVAPVDGSAGRASRVRRLRYPPPDRTGCRYPPLVP